MPVEAEHRGDVCAGRMAREVDPARIATEARRMILRPPHRARRILDEGREAHRGNQAVVRYDGDEAAGGEGAADEAVIAPLAGDPAAAVQEDDHWRRPGRTLLRSPNVELQPRMVAERDARRREPRRIAGEAAEAVEQAGRRATERQRTRQAGEKRVPPRQASTVSSVSRSLVKTQTSAAICIARRASTSGSCSYSASALAADSA